MPRSGHRGTPHRGRGIDHKNAPPDAIECYICAEPVEAFCVFPCGHSTCYSCGLRIHVLNHGGCPVCRVKGDDVFPIITRALSKDEEQYSEEEMKAMRACAMTDRKLKCTVDGTELAAEVAKLYEFVCPMEACWRRGEQDPFLELDMLKDHARVDHKMSYCSICLEHRPAFLCEQTLYGDEALRQHMRGQCPRDRSSFTGHPPCKFCARRNSVACFYDGEALLQHMQQSHFSCDVCNRGQFTFTFYENRSKLNQHFERSHKVCDHQDCQRMDLMLRVFADDLELAIHKQRVHGAKGKVVLDIGDFVASGFPGGTSGGGGASGGGGGGGGGGGSIGSPATGSNTNVLHITFDHIFRRETVEMLPKKSSASSQLHNRNNRNGGSGAQSAASDQVYAPLENGLPPYYRRTGVMTVLRRGAEGEVSCNRGNATSGGGGESERDMSRYVDPSSPNVPGTHAFGVSESYESYNLKNKVPKDPREQEKQLNEILSRELTSPVTYAHFRTYTREFIESKIMTSEYYDLLTKEIFPDRRVFAAVFPLLVATVPRTEKKTALQEVWKMRTAPEQQRRMRAEEEDAARKTAEEERQRQEAIWQEIKRGRQSGGSSNHTNSHGKQNAWLDASKTAKRCTQGGESADGGGDSQATMMSSRASQSASSWIAQAAKSRAPAVTSAAAAASPASAQPAGRSVWAGASSASSGGSASASGPGLGPALPRAGQSYEELFPSLPTNAPRRSAYGQKKAPPKKANAWFSK